MTSTATPSTALIEKTVKAYFAAIRAMDRSAWLSTFAIDGANHDPVGTPPNKGHEALGRFFDGIVGLVDKVGLAEDHVFISANQAAVKWTGTGIGKNKRAFRFEGIDVFEIDAAGKIRSVHAYWNPEALMKQLA